MDHNQATEAPFGEAESFGARRRLTQVAFWRDPTLPYLVDARDTHLASDPFRMHTHDCYLISMLEAGSTQVRLRKGELTATAGDVVIIVPGEPHACNPQPQEALAYKCLFLHPEWMPTSLANMGACVLRDAALRKVFTRAYATLREPGDRLAKDEAFYDLLEALEQAVSQAKTPAAQLPEDAGAPLAAAALPQPLQDVQAYLVEHMSRMVTLEELAAVARLGPHQLLRRFRAQVGLSPHAWQMQRRVEAAKTLLAGGAPAVDAALETGFADQSHFHRVFKRHVGATPGQYQGSGDASRTRRP